MSQSSSSRLAPAWVAVLLTVLGIIFVVLAVLYFADTAAKLPSFMPGHQAGSMHKHTKHGILAAVLAVLAFAGAWLSGGRKRSR
jgi:drug/metabolite transporter (DMT)-like permease